MKRSVSMKIHQLGLWMLIIPTTAPAITPQNTPVMYHFAMSPCLPRVATQLGINLSGEPIYRISTNFTHCISITQKKHLWLPFSLVSEKTKHVLSAPPLDNIFSFSVIANNFNYRLEMHYD